MKGASFRYSAKASLTAPLQVRAQSPLRHGTEAIDSRFAMSQPVISYVLRVDSTDLSGFDVSITLHGARDTVLLAMATHPEYDDKYWRYVKPERMHEGAIAAVTAFLERNGAS